MVFLMASSRMIQGMLDATLDNSLAIATWKLCGACLDMGLPEGKNLYQRVQDGAPQLSVGL